MPDAVINFFGRCRVACDGNCAKAWGINNRPRVQLSEEDEDDYCFLADGELGDAPADPGTYEGGHGKPSSAVYFPNKWCVRECERCEKTPNGGNPDDALELPDYSRRVYNMPWKHPSAT